MKHKQKGCAPTHKNPQNEPTRLRMAVIIQNMVSPTVSGVAFSINPITSLDEIEVE